MQRPFLLLPLLGAVACASDPPDPVETSEQVVLRLAPAPEAVRVEIGRFGSICWLLPLGSRPPGEVRVEIDAPLEASMPCSTTIGFAIEEDGIPLARRRSLPLHPGEGAVICFHDPGNYPWRVFGLDGTLEGTVVVGGGGQP